MADAAVVETPVTQELPLAPPSGRGDLGEVTQDGITVVSNQQTTEQMRSALDKQPAEKKIKSREAFSRIEKLTADNANKDQTISTLNERLAEIDALKKEIEGLKVPAAKPQTATSQPAAETFTDAEPKLEQFANSDDQYRDYLRALASYDRKKDAFEQRQTAQKTQAENDTKARTENFTKFLDTKRVAHDARLGEFVKANPEARAKLESAGEMGITPVIYAAIELGDRGPEFMMALADDPKLARELSIRTINQPVFDRNHNINPLVSLIQEDLAERLSAAGSGSAPRRPSTQAHPPINPVVGSQPKATVGPPDPATSSQEEFDAYWNNVEKEAKRNGRRR